MPRLPKDFSKALVYKLCCKDTTIKEIYIGSTTNFTKRKNCHKNTCNNPNAKQYNYKVYQFIRDNGGWDNWEMILIEYYSCETELLLCRRENYWKNELQASLNAYTPHIYENKKEQTKVYHQEHREQIAEKKKEYQQANKEQILEQKREKYTCECGVEYTRGHKSRHEKSAKHLSLLKQTCSDTNTH